MKIGGATSLHELQAECDKRGVSLRVEWLQSAGMWRTVLTDRTLMDTDVKACGVGRTIGEATFYAFQDHDQKEGS